MGNTWITDMSHFDYPEEETHTLPKQALKLWAFFGSIVDSTVGRPPFRRTAGIRCCRRPERVPCSAVIESELHPDGNEIRWWCPVCGDNGLISNLEGTRWDPAKKYRSMPGINFTKLFDREKPESSGERTSYEHIDGTIEWDEGNQGTLPKIVTVEKQLRVARFGLGTDDLRRLQDQNRD